MPVKTVRLPALVRWLAGGAVLLLLAAGMPLSRMPIPVSSEAALTQSPVARLISENRAAQAAPLARAQLHEAMKIHGADSMQAADAMDALVSVTIATGNRSDLPEALKWARESVRIREISCGGDCPELATSLLSYEALLWKFEDYQAALPLAERALSIRSRIFGPNDPVIAQSSYLLAEAHRALGEFAAAEKLHRQAIAIWQLTPDLHASDIASSLHYLGLMRWMLGDLGKARGLIEQALALRQKAAGSESRLVASDLNTLGTLAEAMQDRAAAMSLFERAQVIWERTLGREDPQVARALTNKARLIAADGEDRGAKVLLERALQIRVKAFGADHYLAGRSLADLGRLARDAGHYPEAESFFARALKIQQRDPQARGPELATTLNDVAMLALETGDPARALNLALQAEKIAREYFLSTSQGLGEEDSLRYETVRSSGLDVALTALARAPDLPEGAARAWGELLQSRALVLDRMAARHRPTYVETGPHATLALLAQRLPSAAALVAFSRYKSPGDQRGTSIASYMAFVLLSGNDSPAAVPIGNAEAIEALVQGWREQAGRDPRLDPGQGGEVRYRTTARLLRQAIWDPLLPELQGRRMVFIVPDGALNLVSLAALPDEDGGYLIESMPSIHYLSTERDLVRSNHSPATRGGVLVLGGAEFDAAPESSTPPGATFRGTAPSCPLFETMRFNPLPGTRREVDDVESLWKSQGSVLKLTGSGAREDAFKRLAPGKRVLHLATHGYFLQDSCPSSLDSHVSSEAGMTVGENPLLLSGLVLAAANRRSDIAPTQDDGILTSEEIGALDLSGTEWAVLSGCDTALGQVLAGEGVVGLRRAFEAAGAGTLIMSLWPVDDGAARIWMHNLYEGRLAGLSTIEAVNQAGVRMIMAQRDAGESTHPYFWGAFVAAGNWR
jgi:CHAT domain-containing protein/tetratricopeptide (TPR) repeat protein